MTRPYLPDLEEFKRGCEEVWANRWLTNNGPMAQAFHAELSAYLGVPETNLALFNNGTLALEMGFKALGLEGAEVITTPFTFVATSHALMRIGAKPVFADIDPRTMCLDPAACEKLITPRTKAIVPVHVYGHVCDVDGFARLGEKHGLKVIYDAAHAFGVKLRGKSIAAYGDMAMFSFHPTKLFHSCEGGLLAFRDPSLQRKLFDLRNFAIHSETECVDVGTNAKMNELQALMGRLCLKRIDELIAARRAVHGAYAAAFDGFARAAFVDLKTPSVEPNDAYCPVLFESFAARERVYTELKERCNVFTRRYFYPLLTDFAPYRYGRGTCPVAEDAAARVLTLPTYHGLGAATAAEIAESVREILA